MDSSCSSTVLVISSTLTLCSSSMSTQATAGSGKLWNSSIHVTSTGHRYPTVASVLTQRTLPSSKDERDLLDVALPLFTAGLESTDKSRLASVCAPRVASWCPMISFCQDCEPTAGLTPASSESAWRKGVCVGGGEEEGEGEIQTFRIYLADPE